MEGYKDFSIPCLMMDVEGLERFFEEKAREGYMFAGFKRQFRFGRFEEIIGTDCWFCVDVYRRILGKKDRESDDFLEYKELCESQGWEFVDYYKNLVVFVSREKERPQSLRSDDQVTMDLLRRLTVRAEGKALLLKTVAAFVWFWIMLGEKIWSLSKVYPLPQILKVSDIVLLVFVADFVLSDVFNYVSTSRKIRLGRETSMERGLPAGSLFLAIAAGGISAWMMWQAAPFGDRMAMGASLFGVAASLIFAVYLVMTRRKPRWKADLARDLGAVILLFSMIISYAAMPRMGVRRFQWDQSEVVFNLTEREAPVRDAGLTYEELGWPADSMVMFFVNPPYQCREELALYCDDWNERLVETVYTPTRYSGAYGLKYVGTVIASLESEDDLETYLHYRDLELSEAKEEELLAGTASYLFPDGKTLVSVRDSQVITYFLSPTEERRFDLDDPHIREAVTKKLEETYAKGDISY